MLDFINFLNLVSLEIRLELELRAGIPFSKQADHTLRLDRPVWPVGHNSGPFELLRCNTLTNRFCAPLRFVGINKYEPQHYFAILHRDLSNGRVVLTGTRQHQNFV